MIWIEILFYTIVLVTFLFTYKESKSISIFSKNGLNQLHLKSKMYGKEISTQMQITFYFIISMMLIFCVYLFELNFVSAFCILTMALFLFPTLLLWNAIFYYRQKQFLDYSNYIQQFINFFKNTGKIYFSLQECSKLPLGDFNEKIEKAIIKLEQGKSFHEGLACIEAGFTHFILLNLHSLVIAYEEYGAFDMERGLDIINEDIEDLIEDCFQFKRNQIEIKNKIFVLALMALVVAFLSKNMLIRIDDALNNELYQCALSIFIMTLILTIIMAYRVYTEPWIDKEEFF